MPRSLTAALSALALAAVTALGAVPASADGDPPSLPSLPTEGRVSESLQAAAGHVTAFVQLDAPSALDVVEAGGTSAAASEAAEEVGQLAEEVVPTVATSARASSAAPQQLSVTSNLVAGTVVSGDADRVRALAGTDDVVAVHLVTLRTPSNKGSDVFTGAAEVWDAYGQTGEGIRIGVIDTGLDYTHAAFGGPGTAEAYEAAYGEDGAGPVPEELVDGAKFLGGYDFAGTDYDASGEIPGTTTVPQPDPNPIDAPYTGAGSGHGTHVAGTAAGYGVTPEGETFRGDYGDVGELSDWQVGPGAAPEAGIYALKVFGDRGGATAVTIDALEWAADPNGDFDFDDRLDVVNLSLGASAAPVDDPENLFVDRLADLGTLSVMSAGNDGDATDVGGSPGNARSALGVANSVGDTMTFDALEVTAAADESLLGQHAMQNTVGYAGDEDAAGRVVHLGDGVDGCAPLDQYAEQIDGEIVWLSWGDEDATRTCGSGARWANATAAGAAGVLIGTEEPIFTSAIAGDEETPGGQLTAASTDLLLEEIKAGTIEVAVGPSYAGAQLVADDTVADTLNPSSSRGAHGSLGVVKPDVAAPGTAISSAASGGGTLAHTLTGSSMAAPHVAGIAALVRAANPQWTPRQAKAAIMNTATHDVWRDPGPGGPHYGPERVGAGRVDGHDAVTTDVIAYDSTAPDLVSASFGVVDVGAETVVAERTITVANLDGRGPARFLPRFEAATTTGGATITTSPTSITVPPGGSRTVTVTLTADPATLEREIDPTSEEMSPAGVAREYVAALSGQIVLGSRGPGAELRVPVHAAPRLVGEVSAAPVDFADAESFTARLELSGRAVDSGGWTSRVAALELVATSPELEEDPEVVTSPTQVAAGDIRHVGMMSTAPQLAAAGEDPFLGYLGVGIAMAGDWPTLGTTTMPVIDTDLDGDGTPDIQTAVQKLDASTDVTVATTYDLETGQTYSTSAINGHWGEVDTTVYDNNVFVAPIPLALFDPSVEPTFHVWTFSEYAAGESGVVDAVEPISYHPFAPDLWTTGGELNAMWSPTGTDLTVHRSPVATAPGDLLVLHSHNAPGSRVEVLPVTVPEPAPVEESESSTTLRLSDRLASYGHGTTADVTVVGESAPPSGTVEILDGDDVVASGELAVTELRGEARVDLPHELAAGTHHLTARYLGDGTVLASSSDVARYTVLPAVARVNLTTDSWRVSPGTAPEVTVEVLGRGQAPVPSGSVTVYSGLRHVATVPVDEDGTATVRLPAVWLGALVTTTYSGDDGYLPGLSLDTIGVRWW